MFKNIIMYYREHHTFPTEDSIPMRLDRSLDEWCTYFDCSINGILSDKEYSIWKKLVKKRIIYDVNLKEKVLKK